VNFDLIVHNWRCFENSHFSLPTTSFVIADDNGSGKTSLLSAFYSLYTGQPWPQTKFTESLKKDTSYYGLITGYPDWSLTGQISPSGRLVNKYQKPDTNPLLAGQDVFPNVFTYLPEDNNWLNLSRSSKLASLDSLLALCFGVEYVNHLKRLGQLVKSKNELLRHTLEHQVKTDTALVTSLSDSIYSHSIEIWKYRFGFFDDLAKHLLTFQTWIKNSSAIQIKHYLTDTYGIKKSSENGIPPIPNWADLWKKELIVGKVLFGAQRDDFDLCIGHSLVQNMFSRGEMRLLVLFIKAFAQETFLKINPHMKTCWLLDDVFNELDTERELIFFKEVLDKSQFYIITSTKPLNLPIPVYNVKQLTKKRTG
jgi:recombinational DNA repair ATPase RecF